MSDDDDLDAELSPGNPAGFMAYHVSIGSSARAALDEWRDLGGRATDAVWYRMYGQVTDTVIRTPDFMALDPDVIPSGSDWGVWEAGSGGKYAMQVIVSAVDTETGLLTANQYTHMSDTPFTKNEAEQAAMDVFGTQDNEDRYGQTVLGAFAVHGWQTVPYGG